MYLNINNLVLQLIPLHKRQDYRYRWLCGLIAPLDKLWNGFSSWRDDIRMLVNVNSQQKVLARYLQKRFENPNISVETFEDGLPTFPLSFESAENLQPMALWGEDLSGLTEEKRLSILSDIPLENENRMQLDGVDFIVRISADIDENEVAACVDNYRQALVTYKIIKA